MAVNLNDLRKKYEDLKNKKSGGGGDIPFMELKEGDNLVRFLSDDEGNFYVETGYHYLRQGKEVKAIACNRLTDGSECYICDVVHELYKSKSEADKKLAKEWRAGSRIFFNIVDRADGEVKVLGAGNTIFKELLKYFADPDWGDLTDQSQGHDVVITKTGTGLDTEYSLMPKPKPSKLGVDVELHDLNNLIKLFTPSEQEALLGGASFEEVEKGRKTVTAEEEEEKPASKLAKRKSEPAPEPEEKPARRAAQKPKAPPSPEEEYADKIEQIDLDIPKAQKALNAWLADEDRTEEELDEIIAKFGKEEEEPTPPPRKAPAKQSTKPADDGGDDPLEDEIQAALAKYKKNK